MTDCDLNDPVQLAIFCAALQGICANPGFFGPTFQGSTGAAVGFAHDAAMLAIGAMKPADGEQARQGGERP